MTDPQQKLDAAEIGTRKPAEFRHVMDTLRTRYRTADFASALRLAKAIGAVAEELNHHPDLDLRWGRLDVTLSSHDVGGITSRDLTMATRIAELAQAQDATPSPGGLQHVHWGLDTWADGEVAPFWEALLGEETTHWFQPTGEHPSPRQRFHPDVWVDPDDVEERIRAALAAGGTLVDDSHAPHFWVLSDAQGNRACICSVVASS